MASFDKLPSGQWRAQVARKGVRKSAAFPTKKLAQEWAAKTEADILTQHRGGTPRKTLREALERYALEVSPTKRRGAWEQTRLTLFARQFERLGVLNRELIDITPEVLGKWRDRKSESGGKLSAETVRRDFTLLSAVFSTARKEWRWLAQNPVSDVRQPAPGTPRSRLPTMPEVLSICRGCGYRPGKPPQSKTEAVAHVFLVSMRTAMRSGEILSLTAKTINLERRTAVLERTKNGDRREVPLSSKAVRLLRQMPAEGWGVSSSTLDATWRKVCNRVGVEGLHLHDARAWALTQMARKVDVLTLARISGHRNVSQLSTYYRATAEQIAAML